jgi:hypothetical protein
MAEPSAADRWVGRVSAFTALVLGAGVIVVPYVGGRAIARQLRVIDVFAGLRAALNRSKHRREERRDVTRAFVDMAQNISRAER